MDSHEVLIQIIDNINENVKKFQEAAEFEDNPNTRYVAMLKLYATIEDEDDIPKHFRLLYYGILANMIEIEKVQASLLN